LQLNRHRFYHPTLGRWLQRDPIRYRDSSNLYNYVTGRPIKFVDPRGLDSIVDLIGRSGGTCVEMTLDEFFKWLKDNGRSEPAPRARNEFWRGCIGVAGLGQACAVSGPFENWPESAPNTTCYRDEATARRHKCGPRETPFYFAKMGQWKGGGDKGPTPGIGDTIPNDSIVPNDDGTFNYVACFEGYCVDMSHCRLGPDGECNLDPRVPADPTNPQVIRFCKKHPGPGGHYPYWMWCVTCKKCGS
jgi:hypothetical protein